MRLLKKAPALCIVFFLLLSGCTSQENDNSTKLVQAEEWLTSQASRYEIFAGEMHDDLYIILAGDKHPEVSGLYTSFRVFSMQKHGDEYSVKAVKSAEAALSAGFTASVLVTDGMTIVFGDIADGVYDYSLDKIVPTEFSEAKVIYDNGKEKTVSISNNKPYMIIMDGKVDIKDIEYLGTGIDVRYSDYFSEDLMGNATSSEPTEIE
jgi:hypothetical protein